MTRTFCFTCAAVASAEVEPEMVWTSEEGSWAHDGTCCRCGGRKVVMEYELVWTRRSDVEDGK